jgi:hypothetical protein
MNIESAEQSAPTEAPVAQTVRIVIAAGLVRRARARAETTR